MRCRPRLTGGAWMAPGGHPRGTGGRPTGYGRSSRWVRENRSSHPVTCAESVARKAVVGGHPSLRELAERGHSEPDAPEPNCRTSTT